MAGANDRADGCKIRVDLLPLLQLHVERRYYGDPAYFLADEFMFGSVKHLAENDRNRRACPRDPAGG